MMTPVRQTEKRYCSGALTAAIFAGLILILLAQKPLARGLILGTLFSILNFILMGETLPRRLEGSGGRLFASALGGMVLRYALLSVPLLVAIRFETYHLITAVVGLFMVQIVILLDHVKQLILPNKSGNESQWKI